MFSKNTYPGKFFVIEGLDGSGQTTQSQLLRNFLRMRGCHVVLTKEPNYNTESGRSIGKVLRKEKEMSAIDLQRLFVRNREEHLRNVIIPVLELGGVIISDRYFYATCAYGAGADGLDLDYLITMNKEMSFILPDITFVLDAPAEICLERITKSRDGFEHFEEKEKLTGVRRIYLELVNKLGLGVICLINGKESKEDVFEQIKQKLEEQETVLGLDTD